MQVMINRKNGSAVLHTTTTTAGFILVGNNSVSNVATGNENIISASIGQIWASSSNAGYWEVKRGANVVAIIAGTSHLQFSERGCSLIKDNTGDLSLTLNGGGVGFIMVEIQKVANTSDYVQQ